MYFSTAFCKKQAFSSYFSQKSGFWLFAQFFPFNLESMTSNLLKVGGAAAPVSCVPAGRSAPVLYAALWQSRSGSFPHRTAAGSAASRSAAGESAAEYRLYELQQKYLRNPPDASEKAGKRA